MGASTFNDMPRHDMVGMIIATALEAKQAGLPLIAVNATRQGVRGLMVWMPGYIVENGAVIIAPSE
jgi:hypothetical protein